MTAEETATATPPLRVISGTASAQEIAALVAVLAAASGDGDTESAAVAPSSWSSPARAMRAELTPGPGAWTASAWPS